MRFLVFTSLIFLAGCTYTTVTDCVKDPPPSCSVPPECIDTQTGLDLCGGSHLILNEEAPAPATDNCSEENAIAVAKSDPRLNFCTKEKYGCTFEATSYKKGWFVTATPLNEQGIKFLALGSDDTVVVSDECKIAGFHYGR